MVTVADETMAFMYVEIQEWHKSHSRRRTLLRRRCRKLITCRYSTAWVLHVNLTNRKYCSSSLLPVLFTWRTTDGEFQCTWVTTIHLLGSCLLHYEHYRGNGISYFTLGFSKDGHRTIGLVTSFYSSYFTGGKLLRTRNYEQIHDLKRWIWGVFWET